MFGKEAYLKAILLIKMKVLMLIRNIYLADLYLQKNNSFKYILKLINSNYNLAKNPWS